MKIKFREPTKPFNKYDDIIDKIFKLRGIDEPDIFLRPTEEHLNNPFLLNNMDMATDRIIKAIENDEKIYIYADVDADGVCSCTTKYLYLKNFTNNINYIYHQREESHGIITSKVPKDCELLIIVDSSTNSVEECKELNMFTDIIILDHHQKNVDNPYAIIVNPQLDDYPNKSLSGSGVVFQTCRALDTKLNTNFAFNYIDIVAIGNIGDMMRQDIMENRYISWCGLWKIRYKECNIGLFELIKRVKKDFNVSAEDISYYIAPSINAVIRLDDIGKILKLFTSNDEKEIKNIAKECAEINEYRKFETKRICKLIEKLELINHKDKIIVINMNDIEYKKSLNGLIATKLSRDYQKPSLVGKITDGKFVGSARGYGNEVDLKTEFEKSGLFELAQGHEASFGVEFKEESKDKIIKYFNKKFKNYFNETFLLVDLEIKEEDLTYDVLKRVDDISFITGEHYERPVFLVKNICIDKEKSKVIGKGSDHIKLIGECEDLEIMKFYTEESIETFKNADWINVVGSIGINRWYNFGTKQLIETRQIISDEIECVTFDF